MWGVPSPVVVNRRFVAKVGVKCSTGCLLAGQPIVFRNERGDDVGHGRLGDSTEPGTGALYAAEVMLDAPAEARVHAWTVEFCGTGRGSTPPHAALPAQEAVSTDGRSAAAGPAQESTPLHAGAIAEFSFRAAPAPEHRVTVEVLDRDTETPLAGAEVRVGVYRGSTDASGQAQIEVQAGSHDLYVRKAGYEPCTGNVAVNGDLALRVAAARASAADLDDDQVWM